MLSVLEVSELLNVSSRRVRALIADGRIPAQLIGKTWAIRNEDIALLPRNRPSGRPLTAVNALNELASTSTPTMRSACPHRCVALRSGWVRFETTHTWTSSAGMPTVGTACRSLHSSSVSDGRRWRRPVPAPDVTRTR